MSATKNPALTGDEAPLTAADAAPDAERPSRRSPSPSPTGTQAPASVRFRPSASEVLNVSSRRSRAESFDREKEKEKEGQDASSEVADGEQEGEEEEEEEDEDMENVRNDLDVITEIRLEMPEWLDGLLAATGISNFLFRLQQERLRRSDVLFTNPNPEIHVLVMSMYFEVAVAFVIVFNCFLIGWQASVPDGENDLMFTVFEHLFCAFFLIEWCLRVVAFGWVWIFELPNFCDTIIVFIIGVIPKWLLIPFGYKVDFLKIFTALRTLRLVRLARAVRHLPQFKECWILIQGLLTSLTPILWTSIMGICVLYIAAVTAVELIGRSEDFLDDEEVQELFGNTLRSLFTMFQMMTLDQWAETVARPVMRKQFGMVIFFVLYIGIAVFVFWNLITAIIVENAFNIVEEDSVCRAKEAEEIKRRELKVLADIFLEIDEDGSGELTHEEFFKSLSNPKVLQVLALLEVRVEELEDLWNILDDGDGCLTIKEFAMGIRRMKGFAKAKDSYDIVKRLGHTSKGIAALGSKVEKLGSTLHTVEDDVRRIATDSAEIVGLFHEMYHRLQACIELGEREDYIQRLKAERLAAAAADEAREAQNSRGSQKP